MATVGIKGLKLNTGYLLLEQQWHSKGDIVFSRVCLRLFWMFVALGAIE